MKAAKVSANHQAGRAALESAGRAVARSLGPPNALAGMQQTVGNAVVSRMLLQRQLDLEKAKVNGAKGQRDIYKDSVTGKLWSKLAGTSTALAWNMMEVTIEGDRWKEVDGKKRVYNPATNDWLADGAPVPVVVPVGWTIAQITKAKFAAKAGNHFQRDEADFEGFHVHVSAYQKADGRFDSFHVKFDPGIAGHISWFYDHASGGNYEKPGQSEATQKKIIRDFKNVQNANALYGKLVAESERIAGVVRGSL